MPLSSIFYGLGLALAIGFLIGVERGWKQRGEGEGERTAGLRTFALIGALGGLSGQIGLHLGAIAFAAIALAFGAAFTLFKYREHEAEEDFSVTGLVAGLVTFALGAYAQFEDKAAAAALAVAVTAILAFKQPLHAWLRALTWAEIRSALLILAMTLIVLPLAPDRAIDPFGAVHPRQLWLLTILVAGASFLGYVALRAFGERAGLYLGAAAGAMVSSTVLTLDLARRAKENSAPP
ncbi:MAG TPA: MgtC/SapB family protein, partial [Caulobacterales bacterium]|nr:MgtC/SapB family protein [Caulobacterales bacterium]